MSSPRCRQSKNTRGFVHLVAVMMLLSIVFLQLLATRELLLSVHMALGAQVAPADQEA